MVDCLVWERSAPAVSVSASCRGSGTWMRRLFTWLLYSSWKLPISWRMHWSPSPGHEPELTEQPHTGLVLRAGLRPGDMMAVSVAWSQWELHLHCRSYLTVLAFDQNTSLCSPEIIFALSHDVKTRLQAYKANSLGRLPLTEAPCETSGKTASLLSPSMSLL